MPRINHAGTLGFQCKNIFGVEFTCERFERSMTELKLILSLSIAAIYERLGWHEEMKQMYQSLINPAANNVVNHRREEWKIQRSAMRNAKTHFVTYASAHKQALDNLILSGNISMINLEVCVCGVLNHVLMWSR